MNLRQAFVLTATAKNGVAYFRKPFASQVPLFIPVLGIFIVLGVTLATAKVAAIPSIVYTTFAILAALPVINLIAQYRSYQRLHHAALADPSLGASADGFDVAKTEMQRSSSYLFWAVFLMAIGFNHL